MLLTKTVKIKWTKRTYKHYIDRGYHFTNYGDEFEVKIEDLTHGMKTKVKAQCDYCGEVTDVEFASYCQAITKNGKYACCKCGKIKAREHCQESYNCLNGFELLEKTYHKKKYLKETEKKHLKTSLMPIKK